MSTKRRKRRIKKPKSLEAVVMPGLRRLHRFWPPMRAALAKQCLGGGKYVCEDCGKIYPRSQRVPFNCKQKTVYFIHVDHIEPVIPLTGFDSWDGVVTRMFCDEDGYQILCTPCHEAKTRLENEERRNPALEPLLSPSNRPDTYEARYSRFEAAQPAERIEQLEAVGTPGGKKKG